MNDCQTSKETIRFFLVCSSTILGSRRPISQEYCGEKLLCIIPLSRHASPPENRRMSQTDDIPQIPPPLVSAFFCAYPAPPWGGAAPSLFGEHTFQAEKGGTNENTRFSQWREINMLQPVQGRRKYVIGSTEREIRVSQCREDNTFAAFPKSF